MQLVAGRQADAGVVDAAAVHIRAVGGVKVGEDVAMLRPLPLNQGVALLHPSILTEEQPIIYKSSSLSDISITLANQNQYHYRIEPDTLSLPRTSKPGK